MLRALICRANTHATINEGKDADGILNYVYIIEQAQLLEPHVTIGLLYHSN